MKQTLVVTYNSVYVYKPIMKGFAKAQNETLYLSKYLRRHHLLLSWNWWSFSSFFCVLCWQHQLLLRLPASFELRTSNFRTCVFLYESLPQSQEDRYSDPPQHFLPSHKIAQQLKFQSCSVIEIGIEGRIFCCTSFLADCCTKVCTCKS